MHLSAKLPLGPFAPYGLSYLIKGEAVCGNAQLTKWTAVVTSGTASTFLYLSIIIIVSICKDFY